jgi:hypothetical protein
MERRIEGEWEDDRALLETRIPDILASFAVWSLKRKHDAAN